MAQNETARLLSFTREQARHWKRLRKGIVPEAKIIKGWIESCEFAQDDITTLAEQLKAQSEIIKRFARHKHTCRMGEYNSIQTGDGCDCGLSDALKGTD